MSSNDGNPGTSKASENNDSNQQQQGSATMFECNICLDTANDPVISMCGHLFCWPCLHQWLETRPQRQECPVCKAGISKDNVVPLYGRGNTDRADPRKKAPPRPQAQRPEPEQRNTFPGINFGNGSFHMSFGIGAFPFGFIGTMLNFPDSRPAAPPPGSPQHEDEVFLSKVFLWVACILMVWLLFA